jgi:hypothetical protein
MADYRGASEHMPLPCKFKGKAFDDPVIMKAYLNYCKRAAEFFQPDFLAIGIETNELYHNAPADWPGYVKLHEYVYREVKRLHPKLPIFTTFTLHSMLNPNWKDREQMLDAFQQLMECNDLVVISFYPFFGHLSSELDEAFAWLTRTFDQFGKPYAVGESGESAEVMRVPFGEHVVTMDGSPELQDSFYKKLLALAKQKKFAFVIESVPRDYDTRWKKNKDEFPPFFIVWKDCGLIDGEGNKRPAYYTWRKYFDMPLKPLPVGAYKQQLREAAEKESTAAGPRRRLLRFARREKSRPFFIGLFSIHRLQNFLSNNSSTRLVILYTLFNHSAKMGIFLIPLIIKFADFSF